MQIFANPIERLQIAQTPLGLFDIRLQHIALPALALVPLGALCQLRLNELAPRGLEEIAPKPVAQLGLKRRMAADEPMLQKRGADGDIVAAKPQAIGHGAAGMADLQLQIPQHIQHGFDHRLGPRGDLPRRQKQQIHIGMRRHFGPPITAHRQNRDTLALGGVGQRVQMLGNRQRGPHQPIGQPRLVADQFAGAQRGLGKCRRQRRIGAGFFGRHLAHGTGPRGARIGVGQARNFGADRGGQAWGVNQIGVRHKTRGRRGCGRRDLGGRY